MPVENERKEFVQSVGENGGRIRSSKSLLNGLPLQRGRGLAPLYSQVWHVGISEPAQIRVFELQ